MKFDFKSQIIASQLQTLNHFITFKPSDEPNYKPDYNSIHGMSGDYSLLFDFLILDGHTIDYPKEEKKELYKLSQKRFRVERKPWVKKPKEVSKESHELFIKKVVEKIYKSYLVRRYLTERYNNTGETLKLHYEDGTEVKVLNLGNIK